MYTSISIRYTATLSQEFEIETDVKRRKILFSIPFGRKAWNDRILVLELKPMTNRNIKTNQTDIGPKKDRSEKNSNSEESEVINVTWKALVSVLYHRFNGIVVSVWMDNGGVRAWPSLQQSKQDKR